MDSKRAAATGHKVGEVAAAAGLTVRALHHYEELLRHLGLPLAEIARALDDPAWQLDAAPAHHLADVDRRLEAATRLRRQLHRLLHSAGTGATHDTESLLHIMEGMATLDTDIQRRIGIMFYGDLEGAYEHLVDVLGLGPGQLTRDDDGSVVHREVHAGDGVI
jgi:DNA-binding transcriptional MerR regulator